MSPSNSHNTETTYKLDELARTAGVSPRTVRYYVQRGLLAPPVFRGRDTVYTGEHLLRLRGIKLLQERFLPLDAIQAELERASPRELEDLIAGRTQPTVSQPRPPAPPEPLHPHPVHPHPVHPHPYRFPGANEPRPPRVESLTRWTLAPGLELVLTGDADQDTAELADELRKWVMRRNGAGGSR